MPTISHSLRPQIGGGEQSTAPHRVQVVQSTGMSMPRPPAQSAQSSLGQSDIKEDTAPQAVTLSPQLTALARRQQKLQQEIEAFKAEKSQFEQQRPNYVSKADFKAKAQQNAVEALKDLGYEYDEISNLILSQQQGQDPVKALEAKIEELEHKQEESVSKQMENTLRQYKAETTSLITADPKAFHFINKGKHVDAVVQHIVETWEESPDKVLTVEQAAKEVEEFLRADAKEKADALRELDPPKEETPPKKQTLPPPRSGARTLTNQVETTPTRTYGQFQHLSMKERIAQAVARSQK